VHLTSGRLAIWALAAVAVGVGAFLIGHAGASKAESPTVQSADGPHPVTVPKLTTVTPLPSMKRPPKPKQPAGQETNTITEGPSGEEVTSESETYATPYEETSPPSGTSGGSNGEAAAPSTGQESTQEPTHEATQPAPSGGEEELRNET
jgi:hypothetical protein